MNEGAMWRVAPGVEAAPGEALVVLDEEGRRLAERTGAAVLAAADVAHARALAGRAGAVLAGAEAALALLEGGRLAAPLFVIARPDEIDAAEAALAAGAADVLPAGAARAEVERVLRRRAGAHVAEGLAPGTGLAELSAEVARIAQALNGLAREGGPARAGADAPRNEPASAAQVRAIIRARRARAQFFSEDLFADPAWDILLDLTAARLERKKVPVSSLCIAAAVPSTTALRWIKSMTDAGILERRPDPADGRRVYIALSDSAAAAMERYLASAARVAAI